MGNYTLEEEAKSWKAAAKHNLYKSVRNNSRASRKQQWIKKTYHVEIIRMVSAKGDLKNADLLMKEKSKFQILTGILQKIKFLVVTGMPEKT